MIKGRDRRRGERERDKRSTGRVEGNEWDAMEGTVCGDRWWRRGRKEIKKGSGKDERWPMVARYDAESLVSLALSLSSHPSTLPS